LFSGIVEAVGTVAAVRELDDAREIVIRAPDVTEGLLPGASIAVDGACLTAVEILDDGFRVEAVGTTLSRTVAGTYETGSRVNLERSLRLGDRLDGHLVQGHVDAVGEVVHVATRGEYRLIDVRLPPSVEALTILHGSIAINGVSLTVNALEEPDVCQVAIIPYTLTHTNLADLQSGDPVNLEGDLIGKYVGRMLSLRGGDPDGPADLT
jgi:riboflavin synthase